MCFFEDHRDKTKVPDALAVEDLISFKLNDRRKLARLNTRYWDLVYKGCLPFGQKIRKFRFEVKW